MNRAPMIDDEVLTVACEAVAAALSPRLAGVAGQAVTWPTPDRQADIAFMIRTRIEQGIDDERVIPWWRVSGENITLALEDTTGIDKGLASHLVGAALHARILSKQDLGEDNVLRLAQCAASWRAGWEAGKHAGELAARGAVAE